MSATIDPIAFRNALGQFATGVTIITAKAPDGGLVGLTANSFSSVSLDPPLVLWSLAKTAKSLEVFQNTPNWAIHVLTKDQMDLSNRFASKIDNKFEGIDIETGEGGTPLLKDYSARFQCLETYQYEGGDHIIFVGKVIDFQHSGKEPLLFHSGKYAQARPHAAVVAKDQARAAEEGHEAEGSFTEDFLMYLLERATPQVTLPFHQATQAAGLSLFAMRTLALLSVGDGRSTANIKALNPLEACDMDEAMAGLAVKGLVRMEHNTLFLTDKGREVIVRLIAAGKAAEADALQDLDAWEQRLFKDMLKRVIKRTTLAIPDPFKAG
ncbi:MAG TPA: flavin reductase family protein [Pseudomonadales bacterium]